MDAIRACPGTLLRHRHSPLGWAVRTRRHAFHGQSTHAALPCATVRPVRRDIASRRTLVQPHPQHEIFSPAAESCSLHAEVTEFPRICRDVSKWRQPRHATIRPHTGATKSYLCTRLNHLTSYWRLIMLALIARWTHNVLLASMALLTIALVVSAT